MDLGGPRNGHMLAGLAPRTSYLFEVRAQNREGWGPWSENGSATTGKNVSVGRKFKLGETWVAFPGGIFAKMLLPLDVKKGPT